MGECYFRSVIAECSKYLNKEQSEQLLISSNNFKSVVELLDYINIVLFELKLTGSIIENDYKHILGVLDKYYNKGNGYSANRLDWIHELRHYEGKIQLQEHHRSLLNFFDLLNENLNDNNIDYFHASGFMCCLLINRELERYHHDIDLYVNIEDMDKISRICIDDNFKLVHTCEKNEQNICRHGYKIESSICNIPIWLNFYKRLPDGTIYIQEYYQYEDGIYFTKENYNSPLCSELSLVKHFCNGIPFTSLSLEALYLSKENNRKKDVFDCNLIKDFIDYERIKVLNQELNNDWNLVEGWPKEMECLNLCVRRKSNA